jgi:purine-binding chemotaxis protein CheW
MSGAPELLETLRRAFDAAFAAEPEPPAERVNLVALRAGGRSWAVRISEVAGVAPLAGLAALPCDEPAMLGLAAIGGTPVPVYDLAALLGEGGARAPRWMLLSAGADRVALAFDELEEYLRVPREQVVAASGPVAAGDARATELVRAAGALRPVVSLDAVLKTLEARLGLSTKGR